MAEHTWKPAPGEGPHGEYAEKCEVCGMMDADMAADKECPGDTIGPDLAVAIGEHAFAAGYRACYDDFMSAKLNAGYKLEQTLADAWSAYTPPEDLCGR